MIRCGLLTSGWNLPARSRYAIHAPKLEARIQLVRSASTITMNAPNTIAAALVVIDKILAFQPGGLSSSPCAGVFALEPPKSVIAPEMIPATAVPTALVFSQVKPSLNKRLLSLACRPTNKTGPNSTRRENTLQPTTTIKIQAPERAHHSWSSTSVKRLVNPAMKVPPTVSKTKKSGGTKLA